MELKEAIDILEHHNRWRRGDDDEVMCNPAELGKAIDTVVAHCRESTKMELTWRDIQKIVMIADDILDFENHDVIATQEIGWSSPEAYYKAVLDKFNEREMIHQRRIMGEDV